MGFPINPPNAPLVDSGGLVTREWYLFFLAIQKLIGASPTNPFDDNILITTQPLLPVPTSEIAAEAALLSPPAMPVLVNDPLMPPPMPFTAPDDWLVPYRLAPGA